MSSTAALTPEGHQKLGTYHTYLATFSCSCRGINTPLCTAVVVGTCEACGDKRCATHLAKASDNRMLCDGGADSLVYCGICSLCGETARVQDIPSNLPGLFGYDPMCAACEDGGHLM